MEEILTPDEAAAYLRISRRMVYYFAKDGQLPTLQVGKFAIRFRRTDLDHYIRVRMRTRTGVPT